MKKTLSKNLEMFKKVFKTFHFQKPESSYNISYH